VPGVCDRYCDLPQSASPKIGAAVRGGVPSRVARACAQRPDAGNQHRTPLCPEIVRSWRDEGGTAVTFGSDAHESDTLASQFRDAAAMAQACSFRPGQGHVIPGPGPRGSFIRTSAAIGFTAMMRHHRALPIKAQWCRGMSSDLRSHHGLRVLVACGLAAKGGGEVAAGSSREPANEIAQRPGDGRL
jgi:hypothetical protein